MHCVNDLKLYNTKVYWYSWTEVNMVLLLLAFEGFVCVCIICQNMLAERFSYTTRGEFYFMQGSSIDCIIIMETFRWQVVDRVNMYVN